MSHNIISIIRKSILGSFNHSQDNNRTMSRFGFLSMSCTWRQVSYHISVPYPCLAHVDRYCINLGSLSMSCTWQQVLFVIIRFPVHVLHMTTGTFIILAHLSYIRNHINFTDSIIHRTLISFNMYNNMCIYISNIYPESFHSHYP